MNNLHRTQVYIGTDQMRRLKLEAMKKHLAVSELIRVAIDRWLKTTVRKADWDSDPLTRAIGKIKAPVTDLSVNHDHYLYGAPKKK